MRKILVALLSISLMTACASATQPVPASPSMTDAAPQGLSGAESNVDILANLPAAVCDKGLTPEDQEGPYFKAGSPESCNSVYRWDARQEAYPGWTSREQGLFTDPACDA